MTLEQLLKHVPDAKLNFKDNQLETVELTLTSKQMQQLAWHCYNAGDIVCTLKLDTIDFEASVNRLRKLSIDSGDSL